MPIPAPATAPPPRLLRPPSARARGEVAAHVGVASRAAAAVLTALLAGLLAGGCDRSKAPAAPAEAPAAPVAGALAAPAAAPESPKSTRPPEVDRSRLGMFAALPEVMEDPNPAKDSKIGAKTSPAAAEEMVSTRIDLGRMLYYDVRLSKNQDISCNTCHDLAHYHGAEPRPVSFGHKHQAGRRNSPSVYNAAGHVAQFWDGRAPDVEHQATMPLLNPGEMATSDRALVAVISSMPAYVRLFKKAFPADRQPVSVTNIGLAIGTFERRLTTPGRWDRFLKGDDDALTEAQRRGLDTFQAVGCAACHNGAYMGGQMYQRAGIAKDWPNQADQGRFELTHQAADKMVFKVPSLRNVAETAPYFHDGSVADLPAAVRQMATMQLGIALSDAQVADIVTFLGALTGKIPADFVAAPNLPPTNSRTPRPSAT